MYELLIQNGSTVYLPPVQEEVKVTTERQISPGSIEFSFVDTGISIAEGNPVRFKDGETGVYGISFAHTGKPFFIQNVLHLFYGLSKCLPAIKYLLFQETYDLPQCI